MDDKKKDDEAKTPSSVSAPNPESSSSRQVEEWERNLMCDICQDFFRVPVSLEGCFHSFCSECIRNHISTSLKSMKRRAECPTCRQTLQSSSTVFRNKANNKNSATDKLIPNRTLEQLVKSYCQNLRPILRPDAPPLTTTTSTTTNNTKRVATTSDNGTDQSEKDQSELREKLPTTFYHGLKRKGLVKLCAKHGLSVQGTDQQLKDRHVAFCLLYNAQSDSFQPMSSQQVAQEIHRRERSRAAESVNDKQVAPLMATLKESLKPNGDMSKQQSIRASSGNLEFDQTMKQHFDTLVAQAEQQCTHRKPRRKWTREDYDKQQKRDETKHNSNAATTSSLQRDSKLPSSKTVANNVGKSTNKLTINKSPVRNPYKPASKAMFAPSSASAPHNPYKPQVPQSNTRLLQRETTNSSSVSNTSLATAAPKQLQSTIPALSRQQTGEGKKRFFVQNVWSANNPPKRLKTGSWKCLVCTLENKILVHSDAKCQACGFKRGTTPESATAEEPLPVSQKR